MQRIYLDHNALIGIAGRPLWSHAMQERQRIRDFAQQGVRFVLSAWHVFELARSEDAENVRRCSKFVDALHPRLWANNPTAVKRAELQRCLAATKNAGPPQPEAIRAFSTRIGAMWQSYDARGLERETFSNSVAELQKDPKHLAQVTKACGETSDAILTRRLAHRDGRLAAMNDTATAHYLAHLLNLAPVDPRIAALMQRLDDVDRLCPMLAVEDALTGLRTREGFTPRPSHAADYQHTLSALAYCDAFITDDRHLFESSRVLCKELKLQVQVCHRVSELSISPPRS